MNAEIMAYFELRDLASRSRILFMGLIGITAGVDRLHHLLTLGLSGDELMLSLAHNQYWARSVAHHFFCRATEEHVGQPGEAMSGKDNQVSILVRSFGDNFVGGVASAGACDGA